VPFDFKGIKLGQSAKEVKQVFNFGQLYTLENGSKFYYCRNSDCDKIKGLTILDQIPSKASFDFQKNALDSIWIDFSENYFDEVRDALKQKYGEPTTAAEFPLSNKLTGVKSKLEHLLWNNVDGSKMEVINRGHEGSTYFPKGTLWIYSSQYINELKSSSQKGKDI